MPNKTEDLKNADSSKSDTTKTTDTKVPWKKNVLEMAVAMGPEHIIENYREHHEGGFYYDHRIIVPKMPDKYTVEPFATRKTGGNHPDTGNKRNKKTTENLSSNDLIEKISFFLNSRPERISSCWRRTKENVALDRYTTTRAEERPTTN
jgi:hypothetical protein